MDAREIKDLLKYVKSAGFHEVELEMEGIRLRVVKDNPQDRVSSQSTTVAALPAAVARGAASVEAGAFSPTDDPDAPADSDEATAESASQAPAEQLYEQKSPMVGTFYRAPSPGADMFVSVNDRVQVGQTLCILEAMKLLNEIEAESAGTIVEIVAENAQPVEYGEILFRIRPDQ